MSRRGRWTRSGDALRRPSIPLSSLCRSLTVRCCFVLAVFVAAPTKRTCPVQSQTVLRNGDWSDAPELALLPQLAAQVDVPFDLSAFFMKLEAKRRDDRGEGEEDEEARTELCPGGRGPTGSGDVPVMAQRQAPAGQGVEPRGSATGAVQAWLPGEYGRIGPFIVNLSTISRRALALKGVRPPLLSWNHLQHFARHLEESCGEVPRALFVLPKTKRLQEAPRNLCFSQSCREKMTTKSSHLWVQAGDELNS